MKRGATGLTVSWVTGCVITQVFTSSLWSLSTEIVESSRLEGGLRLVLTSKEKNTNRAKWWDVRSKIRLQRHSSYHFSPLLSLSLKEARYHVMSSYLETHKSQGQSTASEDPESATMGSSSHPLLRWQQSWLVPCCWPCPEEALNQWHLAKLHPDSCLLYVHKFATLLLLEASTFWAFVTQWQITGLPL